MAAASGSELPDGLDAPPGAGKVAFSFVQGLAAELSGGKIELPGFPHVVARIQRVLNDERADAERIQRVIGSEPVIASQLMRMANSAAINPAGVPIMDLRTAVGRVGLDAVRSATLAFALRQLQQAPRLAGLEKPLAALWRRSIQCASMAHVVARRLTRVNADTAMLAGLLQNVGRLFLLTRASDYPTLFADQASYQEIEDNWHLSIAAALLENWGIADEIVRAVHESENLENETRGPPTLVEVLVIATLLAEFEGGSESLRAQVQCARPLQRLKLDYEACTAFLRESSQDVASLRDALS